MSSDTNINYDFPRELERWIREQFGLWEAAFRELPESAQLGMIQEWLIVKQFIGIEIRKIDVPTGTIFHGMVYPVAGCLPEDVFNQMIDTTEFMDTWRLCLIYALSKVQEYYKSKTPKMNYGYNYYTSSY